MPLADSERSIANLILIGYRGCGKSSVGRLVARQMGWSFLDTDELIEQGEGRSIAAIFAADGEAAFRELERRAIEQVTAGRQQVISVGGGAPLSEANRLTLRKAGLCIWLTARPEELYRRVRGDPRSASQRPALTEQPGLEGVRRVLAARRSFYEAVADHVVETTGRPVAEVAREVAGLWSGHAEPAGEP